MEMSDIFLYTIYILAIGVVSIMFLPHKYKPIATLSTVLINIILTTIPSIIVLFNQPIVYSINLGGLFGSSIIRIDSLSAWFILIINFTVFNGTLYGIGYLKSYGHLQINKSIHWVFFVIFHLSMTWVCMLENGFAFLIAWEVMSISSLMLVLFEYQSKETLKAGINYMIQMHISVALLTAGFIWLYIQTGSFDFASLSSLTNHRESIWVFVLLLIGFAIKGGFIPFHSWLPHAHPAAPSHVSGIMSGVIVKLGIFGIFRVISHLQTNYTIIGEIILSISVITAIYGIANASVRFDYKRMLAYCTIENIGIIGIGIGVGLIGIGINNGIIMVLGFSGALLHTLNHSIFKSLLFFSAGSIYQQTHTRNIEKLGGLIKYMPQTALFFLIGSIAIGGLPPFNGFISEFIIYNSLIKSLSDVNISQIILIILSIAGLAIIGGMSVMTFTKTFGVIFMGNPRHDLDHRPSEVSLVMRIPQYISIIMMLLIAIVPSFFLFYAMKVIISSFHVNVDGILISSFIKTISIVGWINLSFLGIISLVLGLRWLTTRKSSIEHSTTWGCGYSGSIPKAQYTGNSFSKSFVNLFEFFIIENKEYDKIDKNDLFPKKRSFAAFYFDLIEKYSIQPISNSLRHFTNYFQFIQNGKIQAYVLYGIVFIILVFLGTIFSMI